MNRLGFIPVNDAQSLKNELEQGNIAILPDLLLEYMMQNNEEYPNSDFIKNETDKYILIVYINQVKESQLLRFQTYLDLVQYLSNLDFPAQFV